MLTSTIIQAIATVALVCITGFYASETFRMRKSQQRVEEYNAQALIAIEVKKMLKSRIAPEIEGLFELRITLTNLKNAPALRALLQTTLYFAEEEPHQTMFPSEIIPFIAANGTYPTAVLFKVKYAAVFAKASATMIQTLDATDESGQASYTQVEGRSFPKCKISIDFEDHYGNRGRCWTEVLLVPGHFQDGSYGLMARAISAPDSLRCSWRPKVAETNAP